MGEAFPAPPVPAEADLRGFAFMPLDTERLLDSDMVALATAMQLNAGSPG